jgi:ribA/ribD-fused uncharacterized protein
MARRKYRNSKMTAETPVGKPGDYAPPALDWDVFADVPSAFESRMANGVLRLGPSARMEDRLWELGQSDDEFRGQHTLDLDELDDCRDDWDDGHVAPAVRGKVAKRPRPVPGIRAFEGKYYFLSNFYMNEVFFDGHLYPSAEHAYQAAKADAESDRKMVASVSFPYTAKQIMRTLPIKAHWDYRRVAIMWEIVQWKFASDEMADKLLATGDLHLEEGNWWGDRFWGTVGGHGENYLGRMLMDLRKNLRMQDCE